MNTSQGALGKLERAFPPWAGFVMIIAAGVAGITVGAVLSQPGTIALGAALALSGVVAWASGASSTPKVNPFKKTFGAALRELPAWAWGVIAGLFVAGTIIAIVTA